MTDENTTPFSINAAHLERQAIASQENFGPNLTVASCLDHISKELEEVRAEPDDIYEWADIIILAFDGALRRGFTPQQILDALEEKQTINEGRTWPDWRTTSPDRAILHENTDNLTPEEEAIRQGIQSVRKKVQNDIAQIVRTEQTVRAIMVTKSALSELDLVKEVVARDNVSEYLATYAISNLHSRGDLHRESPTGWFTLATPEVEETLLNLVPEDGEVEVAELIKEATKRHPGSRVREAYWKLVTEGHLIPNSAGIIRRGTQD